MNYPKDFDGIAMPEAILVTGENRILVYCKREELTQSGIIIPGVAQEGSMGASIERYWLIQKSNKCELLSNVREGDEVLLKVQMNQNLYLKPWQELPYYIMDASAVWAVKPGKGKLAS